MKNWFHAGIYKSQLTLIAVLVGILCIGQLATCTNNFFDKAYGATPKQETKKEVLVKSEFIQIQEGDEGSISFSVNGKTIMMPKEMRSEEELEGYYKNDTLRLYIAEKPKCQDVIMHYDYGVKLRDDFIEIHSLEGDNELVGTLTYRTSLGRMMLRNNE